MNQSASVRDVVNRMVTGGVDYALLIDERRRLKGILTQNQILRNLENIVQKGWLDGPVTNVMSSPVKTRPLHLYHTAPEFFKIHGVHHAPIVNHNRETMHDEVVAVVTSDMYVDSVSNGRILPSIYDLGKELINRRTFGVASPDGSLFNLLERLYQSNERTDVERVRFANLQTEESLERVCEQYDALILDLEGAPERYWLPMVSFTLRHPGMEYIALAVPADFSESKRKAIEEIGAKGVLKVFEKPLNVSLLVLDVQRFWAQQEHS